jgi:hypothetical protein
MFTMGWFPETTRAWRRFKFLLAELLVVGMTKGDHTSGYHNLASDARRIARDLEPTQSTTHQSEKTPRSP